MGQIGVAVVTLLLIRFQDINREDVLLQDWTDNGIYRVDIAALAANTPIEDASSLYMTALSPPTRHTFFGVFDGHSGQSTAHRLAADLSQVVCLHLADVYSKHCPSREPTNPRTASDEIHSAVKAAFVEVDDLIVHDATRRALGLSIEQYRALNEGKPVGLPSDISPKLSRFEALQLLKESRTGSCALLGIYNSLERTLHVAVTGDSRAVLGRRVLVVPPAKHASKEEEKEVVNQPSASRNSTTKYAYEVHQLSFDQNASNPKEAERLTALHPDEPELLKGGRVLGWGPARAFGNGIMKWSIAVQDQLWETLTLLVRDPEDVLKTPPYYTAEPEVMTFEGVRRGDFLVLASHGLWESLMNEEVVGLVGKWLEERGSKEEIRLMEDSEDTTVEVMLPDKVYPSTTIGLSHPRKVKTDAEMAPSM